jgi:hypothetical protein
MKMKESEEQNVEFWKKKAEFWHYCHAELSKQFREFEQENERLREALRDIARACLALERVDG